MGAGDEAEGRGATSGTGRGDTREWRARARGIVWAMALLGLVSGIGWLLALAFLGGARSP